jgi:hypothetical protein
MDNPNLDVSVEDVIWVVEQKEHVGLFRGRIWEIFGRYGHVLPLTAPGHIVPLLQLDRMADVAVVVPNEIQIDVRRRHVVKLSEGEVVNKGVGPEFLGED